MKTEDTITLNMILVTLIVSMPKLRSLEVEVNRFGGANHMLSNKRVPTLLRQEQGWHILIGFSMMGPLSPHARG